jgi:putative tryptophan/tyrosine transport system substrate-binding protein
MKTAARQEATGNSKKAKVIGFASFALGAMLFALSYSASAQQPKKIPRIGFLFNTFPADFTSRIDVFRQALRELGYVEGKTIFFEFRYAEGKLDRLPALAAELVRLKVEVLVTGGGGASTGSGKEATKTIPIVMVAAVDPVAQGFVTSLARPGGNVTGLSTLSPEISGKRLALSLKEVEPAAGALGVKLQFLDVRAPKDIQPAFQAASKGRAEGVLVLTGPVINLQRKQIAELAAKNRLPAIYPFPDYVEAGGLMSYSANIVDLYRRAATYVNKILKGAKPADLPVEQPKKFEFIINLKAAKQIGLTIHRTC